MLIRRILRVYLYNVDAVIECILPYHETNIFVRMVQTIDLQYVFSLLFCLFLHVSPFSEVFSSSLHNAIDAQAYHRPAQLFPLVALEFTSSQAAQTQTVEFLGSNSETQRPASTRHASEVVRNETVASHFRLRDRSAVAGVAYADEDSHQLLHHDAP